MYSVTGYGSAWLECIVRDDEVAGSNPVTPIFTRKTALLRNVQNKYSCYLVLPYKNAGKEKPAQVLLKINRP